MPPTNMTPPPTPPSAPKEILEKISQAYEKTLFIPAEKPSPQWILMPAGFIGSGKSSVVRPLADHFKLIRISTDEIRKILKEAGYYGGDCRDIAAQISEKYLKLDYSIAVDANTGSESGIKLSQKSKEVFPHVRQIFIHVNTPVEFIVEKLKNDKSKSWLFRDSEHALERFYFHKNNFKLPDMPFTYTFDVSKENFPEQIKGGIAAIEKALLAK